VLAGEAACHFAQICAKILNNAAAAAAAGGIAGACTILGLFVPLYSLVAGFGLKEATALSQAAIAGACVHLYCCYLCILFDAFITGRLVDQQQ
jgi:hypothetical protein